MKKINNIKDLEKLLAQDGWTHETSFEVYASPDDREGETDIVIEVHSKLGDIEIEYRAGCMTICSDPKKIMGWEDLRDARDASEFPSYFTLSRGLLIEGEKVNSRGEIEDPCFRGEGSHEDIFLEDLLPSSFTEYNRAEIDALIKGL